MKLELSEGVMKWIVVGLFALAFSAVGVEPITLLEAMKAALK